MSPIITYNRPVYVKKVGVCLPLPHSKLHPLPTKTIRHYSSPPRLVFTSTANNLGYSSSTKCGDWLWAETTGDERWESGEDVKWHVYRRSGISRITTNWQRHLQRLSKQIALMIFWWAVKLRKLYNKSTTDWTKMWPLNSRTFTSTYYRMSRCHVNIRKSRVLTIISPEK